MKSNQTAPTTIDEYIAPFPPNIRAILERLRRAIRQAAPEAKEKIGYGIPTFTLHGNLVHFAAYKNHIGFYPGATAIERFQDALAGYETSKGTVRFPLNASLPLELIKRIVEDRVQENEKNAQAKRKKK